MPVELVEKIKQAVQLTGLSQQDVMRLCIRIGLKDLERIGWDIAGLISDKATSLAPSKIISANIPHLSDALVAETTTSQPSEPQTQVNYRDAVKRKPRVAKQG